MRGAETILALMVVVIVAAGAARLLRWAAPGMSEVELGRHVVVRCAAGHLFTTTWVPLVSFKAIRLGAVRLQRCPVGDHLSLVTPVPPSQLSDSDRRIAELHDDGGIP